MFYFKNDFTIENPLEMILLWNIEETILLKFITQLVALYETIWPCIEDRQTNFYHLLM